MKKLLLLSLLIQTTLIAQVTDTGDNVGIGNSTPNYKLDVNGTGKFSSNLLIGNPNGARTEINTSTNHKVYAPTNKKTIDLDGNFYGGGYVGIYRSDNGVSSVLMRSQPNSPWPHVGLIVNEMRNDATKVNTIKAVSQIFSGDTQATNYISMPTQNSIIIIGDDGGYKLGQGYGLVNKFKTSFENDVYIESGNLGIGTTTPTQKLDVNGSINVVGKGYLNNGLLVPNNKHFKSRNTTGVEGTVLFVGGDNTVISGDYSNVYGDYRIFSGGNERIRVDKSAGDVGIGTTDTKGFKLGVQGKIAATEVKIASYSNWWPDFVFKNNYNLPTLKEVEQHIKENGHLKDVPSAKKVKEEGFFLGEMDSKLLLKIEELTLYTIEQQKEIESQNSKIEKLEEENKELKSLSKRLAVIEVLLSNQKQ